MEESVLKALLEEGIAAAKAGKKERARQCLMQVVEADENNEQAWLWLSGVVESLEDKQVCLENVLALNPDSDPAKRGLAWIAQQRAEQGLSPFPSPEPPTPIASTPPETRPSPPLDYPSAPVPPTPATLSIEESPDRVIAPPTQPPPAPAPAAAPTPAVRYERRRKRQSRSVVLWLLSIGWGLYGLLSMVLGGLVFLACLLTPTVLPEAAEMGLPWGIGFTTVAGLCIALTVGLLMRHEVAFYASFVMAVLSCVLFCYVATVYEWGCCCWPIAPIVFFGLTFFARDDFAVEEVAVEEERVEEGFRSR